MEGFSNLTDPVVPSTGLSMGGNVRGQEGVCGPGDKCLSCGNWLSPSSLCCFPGRNPASSSWLCFPAWKVTCGQAGRVAQGGQKSLGVNPKSHGSASHHFLSCPGNKWCDSPQLHVPSSSLIPACGRAPLPLFPKTRGKQSGFYLLSKVSVWNSSSLPPSRMFLCNTL